jgi:hypothetical protein
MPSPSGVAGHPAENDVGFVVDVVDEDVVHREGARYGAAAGG